jgi:hypothetical protein
MINSPRRKAALDRLDKVYRIVKMLGPINSVQIAALIPGVRAQTVANDLLYLHEGGGISRKKMRNEHAIYWVPDQSAADIQAAKRKPADSIVEEEIAPGHRKVTFHQGWKGGADHRKNPPLSGTSSIWRNA